MDETPAIRTWTIVESTPPETLIDSGPDGTVASTSATFSFSANEAGGTFECRLDDAAFEACDSPIELTGLAEGEQPSGSGPPTRPATPMGARRSVDGSSTHSAPW